MENLKNELIKEMVSNLEIIKSNESELSAIDLTSAQEKAAKLELGTKVLKLQELSIGLLKSIEIFLNVLRGTIEELPKDLKEWYSLYLELKNPTQTSDNEDVRKLKDYINSIKN